VTPAGVATGVIVSGTNDNRLQFTNPMPASGTNNIGAVAPATLTAWTALGFGTVPTTVTGGATTCTLGNTSALSDSTHTLTSFLTAYPNAASGLTIGTFTPGQIRYFTINMLIPAQSPNLLQGRKATFDMSWTLTQS
jgi:hypothetical protein